MPYKDNKDKKRWRREYARKHPDRIKAWANSHYKKQKDKRKGLDIYKEVEKTIEFLKKKLAKEETKRSKKNEYKKCKKCGRAAENEFLKTKKGLIVWRLCKVCRSKTRRNPEFREKQRSWLKNKKEDIIFMTKKRIRNRISKAIRKNARGINITGSKLKYLGCTAKEAVCYLEQMFSDGMTWQNHGTVWHIDHIMPIDAYDITKESDRKMAFHYTNLQPLFRYDNLSKGNKIIKKAYQPNLLIGGIRY
jgi:hypothetical protein